MDNRAWDERYQGTDLVWSTSPNQFVAAELNDLPPGRAVDLAAGEGRNAIWLAQRGWRVTAVDFSAVGLEKGRRVAEELGVPVGAIEWVCADATRWVAPAGVDLVLVAYLQLPPEQRRAAIRNAYASLAPGGTLLVVAHDATNLTEGAGGPQDPEVLMTAEDLLADLAGKAFEVVHAGRVVRLVTVRDETGERQATAWDALLRLTRL